MSGKPSVAEFNSVIHALYEAAVSPEHWPACMEQTADLLRADTAGLTVHSGQRQKGAMMLMARFDPGLLAEYNQYYCRVNVWKNRFAHLYVPGRVLNSAELCTGRELERTEWYSDFLRRAGGYHSMGAVLIRSEDLSSAVTIVRGKRWGLFAEEQSTLELLTPHFQRALRIHDMMSAYQTTSQALEALPAAVYVLDLELRVRYSNQRGDNLAMRQDGLALRGGRLVASAPASQRVLLETLHAAKTALLRTGPEPPPDSYFALERPSGAAALQAFALPAKLSTPQLPYSPCVVLCVKDPDALDSKPEHLKQLFGFTTQEARLAIQLARGSDLRVASERLRISYQTARKHLSNLRAKANAESQTDLVRLILNGIAPAGRVNHGP